MLRWGYEAGKVSMLVCLLVANELRYTYMPLDNLGEPRDGPELVLGPDYQYI